MQVWLCKNRNPRVGLRGSTVAHWCKNLIHFRRERERKRDGTLARSKLLLHKMHVIYRNKWSSLVCGIHVRVGHLSMLAKSIGILESIDIMRISKIYILMIYQILIFFFIPPFNFLSALIANRCFKSPKSPEPCECTLRLWSYIQKLWGRYM